jgi:hypothetical protein
MTRKLPMATALATGAFAVSIVSTPLYAQRQTAGQPVQNKNQKQAQNRSQEQSKAQRIDELKTVVANDDKVIQLLQSEEPPTKNKNQRNGLIDSITKSRNATMRYVNDLQGLDPETGVEKEIKSERKAAKNAQPAQDRYTALVQARQLVEQNYNALSQEPRKNNHHDNALKFLQQARTPLQQEVDAYAAAHPEVNVAQAQQAVQTAQAQQAAAPLPAQPQGAAGDATALTSPQRIEELNNVIPHLEHSIDMVNAMPDDAQKHKQQTMDALVLTRDTVRHMQAQAQRQSAGDFGKQVQQDHARDAQKQNANNQSGYAALQRIQQYIHNDRVVLARQVQDPERLRDTAVNGLDQANAALQQLINDYNRAHPNEKH